MANNAHIYGNSVGYGVSKDLGLNNISSHIVQKVKSNKRTNSQNIGNSFTQQRLKLSKTPFLFFPEGFEEIFLAIYFITLPYIAGLLFLFFYISNGQIEVLSSLTQESSFILTWAIGYEILASLALLYIVKSAISFGKDITVNGKRKKFRRP